MKKYLLAALVILAFTSAQSQSWDKSARKFDHVFISASFDPNNLVNIVSNPRTDTNTTGLNYRIEFGAADKHFMAYLFWEDFSAIKFYTYGAGFHAMLTPTDKIYIAPGLTYGFLHRDYYGNGVYLSGSINVKAGYKITSSLYLEAEAEVKQRPDISKPGIFQGKVGLKYFFKRKPIRR